jgi:hypothetical protein
MLIALVNDTPTLARPGTHGHCPECGDPTIAKCGELVIWHWAHIPGERNCALAAETMWHLNWKQWALNQGCQVEQVVVPGFRADIVTPKGRIIELQNQGLSPETVRDREHAYRGRMSWIVHVKEDQEGRLYDGRQLADGSIGLWYKRGPKWLTTIRAPLYLDIAGNLHRIKIGLVPKETEWGTSMRMLGRRWPVDTHSVFDLPEIVRHAYCSAHSSHFCPCVKPHLYADDPARAAEWSHTP